MSKVQKNAGVAEIVQGVTKAARKAEIVKAVDAATKTTAKGPEKTDKKVKPPKAVHAKSKFGHWQDSVRGRLDELLSVGGTVTDIAEKAGVTVARVRQHIGDLRAQERGVWGPRVKVISVDGMLRVEVAETETKEAPATKA